MSIAACVNEQSSKMCVKCRLPYLIHCYLWNILYIKSNIEVEHNSTTPTICAVNLLYRTFTCYKELEFV